MRWWLTATVTLLLSACGAPDSDSEESWDENAPTVVESVPAAGDMAVDAELPEVTVKFDQAMEISGW